MTGPDDNEHENFQGLHGPSESDIERFNREDAEYLDDRKRQIKSAVWKLIAGAVFIIVVASMLLNVLIPAFTSNRPVVVEPERTPATVLRVFDGRTISVDVGGIERTIRYIGIEIPEFGDPLYDVAIEANRQWLAGQEVLLEADEQDVDSQGRLLRYVWFEGGLVNEILVASGLARVDASGPNDRYSDALRASEANARARELGIWDGTTPERTARIPGIAGGFADLTAGHLIADDSA